MTPEARKRRRAQAQKHNTDVREDVRRVRWERALYWASHTIEGTASVVATTVSCGVVSDDVIHRLAAVLISKYDIRTRPKNWPSVHARQERGA
jgi:hypothetical protein